MNNSPCCHKCASLLPFKELVVKLTIKDDMVNGGIIERILCHDCAELILKFIDEEEMTVEELTKLYTYKKGYDAGYDDGIYDQWQESAGDDL